jgi:hypothetical protein
MRLKVQVTERHIQKGKPGCSSECPVALAVLELLKPEYTVAVDCGGIEIYDTPEALHGGWDTAWTWNKPTQKFANFIEFFDDGPVEPGDKELYSYTDADFKRKMNTYKKYVKPFEFSVTIPDKYLKQEVIDAQA